MRVEGGRQPSITVTVRNVGGQAGSDVPQIYLTRLAGQPTRRLVAFSRVSLGAGESRVIHLRVERKLLAQWTEQGWMIPAGRFEFAVGRSALELEANASVQLQQARLGR